MAEFLAPHVFRTVKHSTTNNYTGHTHTCVLLCPGLQGVEGAAVLHCTVFHSFGTEEGASMVFGVLGHAHFYPVRVCYAVAAIATMVTKCATVCSAEACLWLKKRKGEGGYA